MIGLLIYCFLEKYELDYFYVLKNGIGRLYNIGSILVIVEKSSKCIYNLISIIRVLVFLMYLFYIFLIVNSL